MAFERLILATASPRRINLFHQLDLTFEVQAANVEEPPPEAQETPSSYTQRLAALKAQMILDQLGADDAWVIGADTVVVLKDKILGKPRSEAHAQEMLTQLSGHQHEVITGFAILHKNRGIQYQEAVHTKVLFRELTPHLIARYIRSGEPMDKAGSYGIQGKGAVLVERVEGCYFNVVGFPISHIIAALEHHKAGTLF